jgi:hypothetical protein
MCALTIFRAALEPEATTYSFRLASSSELRPFGYMKPMVRRTHHDLVFDLCRLDGFLDPETVQERERLGPDHMEMVCSLDLAWQHYLFPGTRNPAIS